MNDPLLDELPRPMFDLHIEKSPPATSAGERRRTPLFGLILHVLLVFAHIALLIVWSHHYEHNASFAFTTFSSTWLPTIITFVSQAIGVVSCFNFFRTSNLVYS